ncbi:unnamed protein product [Strongylus vulgaris]|uniref:C2 domain-containing protein n=1 Tax=Strongylus vulgaris TaxID=40348 RepID=A0A3P7L6L7_STRVU|nr:unnamed protein product [Strongylus vulgaris]
MVAFLRGPTLSWALGELNIITAWETLLKDTPPLYFAISEEPNLHVADDTNFGRKTFLEADVKTTWHVLLRVIEGRDLKTGSLRVRAYLEGMQKCTRVCSQGAPRWKQNLVFMLKDTTLQKLASQTLAIKVTRAKRFSEKVKGEFFCLVGAIIHSPGQAVISKWIAMRAPFDEDDDEAVHENCGFLKVSLCVFGMDTCPPRMNDDIVCDEIWNGAQLEEASLRVRLFRLHQIAEEIHRQIDSNKGKPIKFSIKVTRAKRFSEKVKGEFFCLVGAIIHSPGQAVISKWIAMRAPFDEDDDEAVHENCGFLKVSLCVFGMDTCPPRMNDDIVCDEIWNGAQLEEASLRVRLFRLHQIAEEIHRQIDSNKGKPIKFSIKVAALQNFH